ncbi:MAG: hypothetical protein HDT29_01490 [Clostridiales bacterium]|nr:hypothetical protein [Clostridiales bacterium]
MNKKRLFILTALMLTVCLIFTMFAVACDKDDEDENGGDTSTSSLLFTNGTFSSTGENSELSSPSSWTGAVGSSSSSSATPSGESNLRSGVVSSATKAWKSLKRKYSDIEIESPGRGISSENGNKELDDDNILMIYNKVATSYKYTSTSHSLDINSYYKLSIDVKTILDADNTDALAGAYISVSGSAEANWEAINTQGEWKTYVLYIETSELSSGTLSVVLSNGTGSTTSGHMSKGYAFFDNVVLEKVSEVDEDDSDAVAFTKADYDKVQLSANVAKYSMKTANAEFDFASSTTSIPYTPSKYSLVAGFGSGDTASTSSTDTVRGIIDTNNFSNTSSLTHLNALLQNEGKTLADLTTPETSIGTRMLYMQSKGENPTAFGYRSSVAMNFDTNKYYEVSIWARTYVTKGNATIRLTDGTNEDSNGYVLNADSHDNWTKYTFYVQANQFRATSLYLELWLGWGGKDDVDTLAYGAVLFDSLSLNEITSETYNAQSGTNTQTKISLYTSEENMESISLNDFAIQNEKDVIANRSVAKVIDTKNFVADEYFTEDKNPGMPVIDASDIFKSDVLAINNYYPTSTVLSTLTAPNEGEMIDTSKLLPTTIKANEAYAISMYIKTIDVDTSKGLNIELLKYNKDYDEKPYDGKNFSKAYTSVSSFSNLNTENLDSLKGYNDYTLITFYVLGAEIEDTKLAISISLGSGNGSDYSTLTMGYGFVSSIYIEKLSYSGYTSASTSSVVNKVSLANSGSSSEVSSNGFFNYTDISATINLFGDDWKQYPVLGLPTGWSSTDSSKITKPNADEPLEVYPNMAGIFNLDNQDQADALGVSDTSKFYEGAESYLSYDKHKNVLAIKKNDDAGMDMLGFKSNTISLSANSFYEFKIWAKANDGDQFSIVLSTVTATDSDYKYAVIDGDGAWHEYSIFVETGISSVSVTLTLAAGAKGLSPDDCTVFFTHLTYGTVDSKVFENASKNEKPENFRFLTQSWLVDSFDDVDTSDSSIVAPKNFNGSLVDSDAPSDDDSLIVGVIDKNKTDFSDIDLDTDKPEDLAVYNAIFNDSETTIGDRALVIYNKENTSYAYTSNSATISSGKYYKISVWVLTYKLASTEEVDEYFVPTATITLKANNKTYEFGRKLNSESEDYDKSRIVNTSTYEDGVEKIGKWTEYAFYIYAEDDISSTTATLSVGLGFDSEDYRMTGYVFVDNFSVDEIDEADFIARKDQYGEDANGNYYKDGDDYKEITDANYSGTRYKLLSDSEVAKLDNSLNSQLKNDEAAKQNFRIVFTSDDSTAEPENNDTGTDDEPKTNSMMWLYISLGAVSGIIVIIVVIYLIKKFAPKRKKKLVKSGKGARASGSSNSKRDQFGK